MRAFLIEFQSNFIKYTIAAFSSLFFYPNANSQKVIYLKNPSFEKHRGIASHRPICENWDTFNDSDNSPPTIHSKGNKQFKVMQTPSEGKYFLSLVTRYDTTWESIVQKLSQPLKKDSVYSFALDLCTSDEMKSVTKRTWEQAKRTASNYGRLEPFNNGAILRIQGTNSITGENEILVQTEQIKNTVWEKKEFVLKPTDDYDVILIEAFFDLKRAWSFHQNGNILIDNCSPIRLLDK